MKILVLDCEDSFTYNIIDYIRQCQCSVDLIHYSEVNIEDIRSYAAIVLPPGPNSPEDIPILFQIIDRYQSTIPILGICLGHQAIGQYYGHAIAKSSNPMHGLSTKINFEENEIFQNIDLKKGFAMRYNSLTILDKNDSALQVICRDEHHEIMGFQHSEYPLYSFQFHPESIGSNFGLELIINWVVIVRKNRNLQLK